MSSSEGSPSRWSTTGVAAYRRRRDAATQTPVGGENGNSNGIGQGDQMERLIASQNRLAAAIEFQGWQNARLVEVLQMQSAGRPLCLRCGRWGHLASTCGRS